MNHKLLHWVLVILTPALFAVELSPQDSIRTYDTRAIDAFMDGMDLESAGEIEQAIQAYQRALAYDPDAVDI